MSEMIWWWWFHYPGDINSISIRKKELGKGDKKRNDLNADNKQMFTNESLPLNQGK